MKHLLSLTFATVMLNAGMVSAQWSALPDIACTGGFGFPGARQYTVSDNGVIFRGVTITISASSGNDVSVCRSTDDNLTTSDFFFLSHNGPNSHYLYSMTALSDTSFVYFGTITGTPWVRKQYPNGAYESDMMGPSWSSYAATPNYLYMFFFNGTMPELRSMNHNVYTGGPLNYSDLDFMFPAKLVFANDSVGFLMAHDTSNNYVLVRTQDHGANWTSVLTSSEQLNALDFNGTDAVLVGNNGICYRSADTGNTWTQQTAFASGNLTCVDIHDSICYAGGENGILYRSSDLGTGWNPETSGVSGTIDWIKLTNNGAGYFQSANVLYKNNNVIGLKKEAADAVFSVYPNPSSGVYSISRKEEDPCAYEICDAIGRSLQTGVFEGTAYTLDLKEYRNGLYLLRLKDLQSGKQTTGRLLKQ